MRRAENLEREAQEQKKAERNGKGGQVVCAAVPLIAVGPLSRAVTPLAGPDRSVVGCG